MSHTPTLELISAYKSNTLTMRQEEELTRFLWLHDELVAAGHKALCYMDKAHEMGTLQADGIMYAAQLRAALAKAEAK